MPLAEFTIQVNDKDTNVRRDVGVIVYDSLKGMRIATSQYAGSRGEFSNMLGVCHRFASGPIVDGEHSVKPLCAIVRLAKPHIGVGVVSHEMTHAAVWIRELDEEFEPPPLTTENDEEFCWLVGELVRQAINGMTDAGVYD